MGVLGAGSALDHRQGTILNNDNEFLASHVSLWELAIKAQKKTDSIPDLASIEEEIEEFGVRT